MDAHKEPDDEKQEDKEHDKEFKEVYKGTAKRSIHISWYLASFTLSVVAVELNRTVSVVHVSVGTTLEFVKDTLS